MIAVMALFWLPGCGPELKPEESCYFIQNQQFRRISWGDNLPVKLYVHEGVPEEFHEDIKETIELWNQGMGRTLLEIESFYLSGAPEPKRDNHSVIYWLETWEENKSNEQGRTTIHWRGDRIYEADIRINAKNFKFFTGDTVVMDQVHFKSLLLHELGHALGLDHREGPGSVMNPSLANGMLRDHVGEREKESLSCEY